MKPGSPAEALGMAPGDRLRYARLAKPPAGEPALEASRSDWDGMNQILAQAAGRLGHPLLVDWVHEVSGEAAAVEHTAESWTPIPADPLFRAGLPSAFTLGATLEPERIVLRLPGLLPPCGEGLRRAKLEVLKIGRTVGRFFAPPKESLSPKVLGGPITIFLGANHFLDQGAGAFLLFLGVISVNLAVLNVLPVPVLDGGLLLLLLIEKVRGTPLGERATAVFQYSGLALILTLVVFVFYNDITLRLMPILAPYLPS